MSNNERNKEAVRQLFEDVVNKGRTELLKDIVSDDYVNARGEKGAAEFQSALAIVSANPAAAASQGAPRFIDKFFIPVAAISEFHERMKINRNFLRTLSGFVRDVAYEHPDEQGNLICVTIAEWESMDVLNKAKEAVQAEYKREGFDPVEMFQRLHISMDRGIYTEVDL
jgi:hypothetical protein